MYWFECQRMFRMVDGPKTVLCSFFCFCMLKLKPSFQNQISTDCLRFSRNTLDKSVCDREISFSFRHLIKRPSSPHGGRLLSNPIYAKSSFKAAEEVGLPVSNNSARNGWVICFIFFSRPEWLSTIQGVFKTQGGGEADLNIGAQSCRIFKMDSFLKCKCLTWSMMNILGLKDCHPVKACCHAGMTCLQLKGAEVGNAQQLAGMGSQLLEKRSVSRSSLPAITTSRCNDSLWGRAGWSELCPLLTSLWCGAKGYLLISQCHAVTLTFILFAHSLTHLPIVLTFDFYS